MVLAPTQKRAVYFNEFNVLMHGSAYLPLVSGLLQSYVSKSPGLSRQYEFKPFLFYRDRLEKILAQYDHPAVAAFSVSMWNEQLSLKVAQQVKASYPDCLIVMGGPQVPHQPAGYFAQYPFIDVAVKGEGEEAFGEVLARFLESKDFSGIASVAYRDPATGRCVVNDLKRPQSRDLDIYPSPYLEGVFDPLIANWPDLDFQAIIETNRGCPFLCTFCFWGQGGLSTKYRFHSLDRVRGVLEWCAKNRIRYVFNADSNFGMHPRDREIAEMLVELKKQHGYPEKFRTCFGKNTDERIFEVGKILHSHELEKGITLARQSNDDQTLQNIRRQNIKLDTYRTLQLKFNESNIPVYTELILGLPGETFESWLRGIDDILNSGIRNQLFVYMCQVLPNTEMAAPEYRAKFKIETTRIPLAEIHGAVRADHLVREFEDIIIRTDSMTTEDWKRMAVLSWVMQVLHSLKMGYFVMVYLHETYGVRYTDLFRFIGEKRMPEGCLILHREISYFERQLEGILSGKDRAVVMPEYGNIYWDVEEACFLRISQDLPGFYRELESALQAFLDSQRISYNPEELAQAIEYQRLRIPLDNGTALKEERTFSHNFPEYFEHYYTSKQVPLRSAAQTLRLAQVKDYAGNKKDYARETILWGRKSGTLLTRVEWFDLERV